MQSKATRASWIASSSCLAASSMSTGLVPASGMLIGRHPSLVHRARAPVLPSRFPAGSHAFASSAVPRHATYHKTSRPTALLPLGADTTEYRLLIADGVTPRAAFGKKFIEVAPELLTFVAREGMRD